jgi:hypothetical protein
MTESYKPKSHFSKAKSTFIDYLKSWAKKNILARIEQYLLLYFLQSARLRHKRESYPTCPSVYDRKRLARSICLATILATTSTARPVMEHRATFDTDSKEI